MLTLEEAIRMCDTNAGLARKSERTFRRCGFDDQADLWATQAANYTQIGEYLKELLMYRTKECERYE